MDKNIVDVFTLGKKKVVITKEGGLTFFHCEGKMFQLNISCNPDIHDVRNALSKMFRTKPRTDTREASIVRSQQRNTNIFGRKVLLCSNPHWWVQEYNDFSEKWEWTCRPAPSYLYRHNSTDGAKERYNRLSSEAKQRRNVKEELPAPPEEIIYDPNEGIVQE